MSRVFIIEPLTVPPEPVKDLKVDCRKDTEKGVIHITVTAQVWQPKPKLLGVINVNESAPSQT